MHEKKLGCELPTPAALSYVGDAVHSLYVRRMLVLRGITRSGDLNAAALSPKIPRLIFANRVWSG
jgi:23S rRNA maturation mini-RNase III